MRLYILSMALTVIANLSYHICQRSISRSVHPFVSLAVTYAVGLVVSLAALPFVSERGLALGQLRELNWASYALGGAIVALELGFLLVYRAGWNISVAALSSNVAVTLLLIPLGLLVYNERIDARRAVGIVLSIVGIWLIVKK